jgi:hypothetical protein
MDHGRGDACGGKTGEKTGKGCCTTFSILYISDALVPNTMEITIGAAQQSGQITKKEKKGERKGEKKEGGEEGERGKRRAEEEKGNELNVFRQVKGKRPTNTHIFSCV